MVFCLSGARRFLATLVLWRMVEIEPEETPKIEPLPEPAPAG
jgi:hypothetical protein